MMDKLSIADASAKKGLIKKEKIIKMASKKKGKGRQPKNPLFF